MAAGDTHGTLSDRSNEFRVMMDTPPLDRMAVHGVGTFGMPKGCAQTFSRWSTRNCTPTQTMSQEQKVRTTPRK